MLYSDLIKLTCSFLYYSYLGELKNIYDPEIINLSIHEFKYDWEDSKKNERKIIIPLITEYELECLENNCLVKKAVINTKHLEEKEYKGKIQINLNSIN